MMTYKLQGCKKSAVIGWMAGMLLLAGCTQDKPADTSQGEMLPEGKYPMTFTVTGLEATATTRVTADGKWDDNEEVAVKIRDEVKKYVTTSYDKSTKLNAVEGVIPFYWQSTNDTKQVSAWYLGTGYQSTLPTEWSVSVNQNDNDDGYQKSDFLYAPEAGIDFQGTNSLTFYHQTAKLVVNIRNYGVANDDENISTVTINAVKEGIFQAEASGNHRLSAKTGTGVTSADITFQKLIPQNTDVVFKDGEKGETALASYQALVIPQTVNNTAITINMKGYSPFKYVINTSSVPTEWESGMQYTYNLTIKGEKVTVTVTSTEMTWGDGDNGGSGGNGSVEI